MNKTHLDKVKSKFDDTYAYTKRNSTIYARFHMTKELLKGYPYRCILDLGCGDGSIGVGLADMKTRLHLMDLSDKMLAVARAKAEEKGVEQVEIFQGDATNFNSGETYDVVVCLGVLAHVPDIPATLATLSRHTKKGGRVILQFTEKNSLQGMIAYTWFKNASPEYTVNETSMVSLLPALNAVGLHVLKKVKYTESSLGTNKLGISVSTKFKTASSKLGILSHLFSGNILLLEKR